MADWEYRNIELNDPRSEATELDLLGKTARRLVVIAVSSIA